jgi:hypothetical protein
MWWAGAASSSDDRRDGPSKTAGVQFAALNRTSRGSPAQMAIPLQGIWFRNSWSLHEARLEAAAKAKPEGALKGVDLESESQ